MLFCRGILILIFCVLIFFYSNGYANFFLFFIVGNDLQFVLLRVKPFGICLRPSFFFLSLPLSTKQKKDQAAKTFRKRRYVRCMCESLRPGRKENTLESISVFCVLVVGSIFVHNGTCFFQGAVLK